MISNTAVPREYGMFRDKVLSGEIVVNYQVSLQMNLIDSMIENPNFYYDDSAIDGFIEFCETEMTLTNGEPFWMLPSFKLWAEDLLAWYHYPYEKTFDPDTGEYYMKQVKRRLRNSQYLIVGRGAAKSLYSALIQMYFLLIDPETTKQIVVAPVAYQADEITGPIMTAITKQRGPLINFMANRKQGNKPMLYYTTETIFNMATNSIIEVRPMRIDKIQGLRTKINSVDEWLSGDIKENVFEAIAQGAEKVDDYIILATSSEGTVRNGIGDTIKLSLEAILMGEMEDYSTSIWMYRLDDITEINDPRMWIKANPNLGTTVKYEKYQAAVDKIKSFPQERSEILAKRFGIPLEGFTYFFTYEETLCHRKQNYDGMECSMGADLSQADDFTAFTFLFPLGEGRYGVKTRAYVPERKVQKLHQALFLKYEEFVQEDTLCVMSGVMLDLNEVWQDLFEWISKHNYQVNAMGYDPYNAAEFLSNYIADMGDYNIERVRQGVITESVPLGELKLLSIDRNLVFDEELMKFAMGNSIVIEDNNGNRKLSKKRNDEKIDNVSALMDAWVAYKLHKEVFIE